MKKSFTRLLGYVVLLNLLSFYAFSQVSPTSVWPKDSGSKKAYTKTTDKLRIIYPGNMVASSGSIRLLSKSGSVLLVVPASDSRVSFELGDTILIDLSNELKQLTNYKIYIDKGAFKKAVGGNESAVISNSDWTFTTGDYDAPVLTGVVPRIGSVVNKNIIDLILHFKDNKSAVKINGGNVSLYKSDGNIWDLIDVKLQGSITTSGDTTLLTLSNIRELEENTDYFVTYDQGLVTDEGLRADGVKNACTGLSDRTAWQFTSGDYTIPEFAKGYPKLKNTGTTSVDVHIRTNEPGTAYVAAFKKSDPQPKSVSEIKNASIKGDVKIAVAGGDYAITLNNLGSADKSEPYTIYVIVENKTVSATFSDRKVLSIITAENIAPKLLLGETVQYKVGNSIKRKGTVSSSNTITTVDRVDPGINSIVLEFDEQVKPGTGSLIIYRTSDNSEFLTVDASRLSMLKGDTKVKIPVSGLANYTGYYILISGKLIQDSYGNYYQGMTSKTAWEFTTDNSDFPTYSIVPADGTANVKKESNIVITFNKLVNIGSGAFELMSENKPIGFSQTVDNINGIRTTVKLDPTNYLPSDSVVEVKLIVSKIKDNKGDSVAIIDEGIAFVTEDYESPKIDTFMVPVKPSDVALIKFNEPVRLPGGDTITSSNLFTILTVKNKDANGPNISYSAKIDEGKKTITIQPDTPWKSEEDYYIAVSSGLKDASGNDFDGMGRSRQFTIDDVTSAKVDLSSVAGKMIKKSDVVKLIFKEEKNIEKRKKLFYSGSWHNYSLKDMSRVIIFKENGPDGRDVPFTVTNPGNDSATFVITNTEYTENKSYYLGVGASTKGEDGNINQAGFATFSTVNESDPKVVTLLPADDSKGIDGETDLIITFDSDIDIISEILYKSAKNFVKIKVGSGIEVKVDFDSLVIAGNQLKIRHIKFPTDATVTITISDSVILNKTEKTKKFAGFKADQWNFRTTDTKVELVSIGPDIVSKIPNTSNIPVNTTLQLEFNERVKPGTGNIDIRYADSDNIVERIDISRAVFMKNDSVIEIKPVSPFKYNTKYYVEVDAGAVTDYSGNKSTAIQGKSESTDKSDWTFITADTDIKIVKITPANGSDKAGPYTPIEVEFNRAIKAGTKNVGFLEVGGSGNVLQTYPVNSSNISISGKKLTIKHDERPFTNDREIFLYIESNAVEAATGSKSLGEVSNTSTDKYVFYTRDENPPQVASIQPGEFKTTNQYIPVNTSFVLEFDEDIRKIDDSSLTDTDISTAGSGAIFSLQVNGKSKPFKGTISGRTVTLTPNYSLPEDSTVVIKLLSGKVEDKYNKANKARDFIFKTKDSTIPVVSFILKSGLNQLTLSSISVTDDNSDKFYYHMLRKSGDAAPTAAEIMKKGKSIPASGTISDFSITGLESSTAYVVYALATDSFDNVSAIVVKEAITDDTQAPELVAVSPATGAEDVDVDSGGDIKFKLTFNEDVMVGKGIITVRNYDTGSIRDSLDQSALQSVPGDSKSVQFTLNGPASFANDEPVKLYVELSDSIVKDRAANPNWFAGTFGKKEIWFTTEDNKAPAVVPGGGTKGSDVPVDKDLTIAFSEVVKGGEGKLVLYKEAVTAANAIEMFDSTDATISANMITVNPKADLENGKKYYLEIRSGFVTDISGNKNENSAAVISFVTSQHVKPVAAFNPSGGSTAISKDELDTIEIKFNIDIYLFVEGYLKPLPLLSQSELLSAIRFTNGKGEDIPALSVQKKGSRIISIITSKSKFEHESEYRLVIDKFKSSNGLGMDKTETIFKTSDGVPPAVTFNPEKNTTNVPMNSNLKLAFSENIYADVINVNEGIFAYIDISNIKKFVYLREESAGGKDVEFNATISSNSIVLDPVYDFQSDTKYYFGLLKDVKDINGNVLKSSGVYAYFTTRDTIVPQMTDMSPKGSGVAGKTAMWIEFDEYIEVSTGNVKIRRQDGTIFETIGSGGLSVNGKNKKRLDIVHSEFENFTEYFVELEESVVNDKSGNANKPYSNPVDGWKFTTSETFSFDALLSPRGDNTLTNASIELKFNKKPIPNNNRYLAIYRMDGTAVYQIAVNSMNIEDNTARYRVALETNTHYYARIEKDAFKSSSNEFYLGIMDDTWTFSTVDNISPKVISLTPPDNTIDLDPETFSFSITFNREIKKGTGKIALRLSNDGSLVKEIDVRDAVVDSTKLMWVLDSSLMPLTKYYYIVPEGLVTNTEITADPFKGILDTYTWSFETSKEIVYPELVSWTPVDTIEGTHPEFVMTFADTVKFGEAGNLFVTEMDSASSILELPITAGNIDGNKVTVSYVVDSIGGLNKNTTYSVTVDPGVLVNNEGKEWEGITGKDKWIFTTGSLFTTGIEDPAEKDLYDVNPNPFNDHLYVKNSNKLTRIIVRNIIGHKVIDLKYPQREINTEGLVSGIYLVTLINQNKIIQNKKLIKR